MLRVSETTFVEAGMTGVTFFIVELGIVGKIIDVFLVKC
ncbi:hypothetical protein Cs308_0624 [Candidatus Chlamydia sanziniae]|uniref:Uncharacterized protein n=1 Tax=Candidatus Chlamydia sanziniae TaxID=1806891 RepID=A0A1A9HXM6_9CHLA|nr:hypothetical protein Cs308_0624 [Candidatus Chlamydia sanziniae]